MLQVIESKDIRPGEPRWFCPSLEDAQACMKNMEVGDLHTDDAVAVDCVGQEFAIVDRPSPSERDAILDDLLHHHEDHGGYRDPRDTARIDPILGRLRAAWVARPDQRLGQLLVNSLRMPPVDPTPFMRLYNAECAEFGAAGAPIEWPTPSPAQPPPVLDLDALAEAERAMTQAPWSVDAGAVPMGDTGDYDHYIRIPAAGVYMEWPELDSGNVNARGIAALRNAAPYLIPEARAAVALRGEIAAYCRLTTDVTNTINAALGSDARLGAEIHHEVVRIVGSLREKLADAKRLGTEVTRLTAELTEMSARAREADAACAILGATNGETLIRAAQRVTVEARMVAVELAAVHAVPPDVEAAIVVLESTALTEGGIHVTERDTCRLANGRNSLRAAIARAISDATAASQPATVGGMLATAPVGSIVEWRGDDGAWIRCVVGEQRASVWYRNGWSNVGYRVDLVDDIRLPARIVPADQADADPATRGPIGVARG